jgi:hypothetical protein
MRLIHLYLIGYFALVGGAALSLWRAGVLYRISPTRLALIAMVVVGLGVALALMSAGPATPKIPKRDD